MNNYLSLNLCKSNKIWPNDKISAIYSNAVNRRKRRLENTNSKNNGVPSFWLFPNVSISMMFLVYRIYQTKLFRVNRKTNNFPEFNHEAI